MTDQPTREQLERRIRELEAELEAGKTTQGVEAQHRQSSDNEAELRARDERYRSIFESIGTAMVIDEQDTTIYRVNSEYERLMGYDKSELEGKRSWLDFVAPEDLERVRSYHDQRGQDPAAAPKEYEFRLIDKGGLEKPVLARVGMLPGTRRTIASLLDLSPLREAEKLFRDVIMGVDLGLYLLDEGRFQLVNTHFLALTGYGEEDLRGKPALDLVLPEDRERVNANTLSMLAGERAIPYEFRIRRRDGRIRWVMETVSTIDYHGKPAILGTQLDVTEKKRYEQELQKAQKLESIGQLSDGLAHDFNNLLTVVLGHADLVQDEVEPGGDLYQSLEEIKDACLRAKELTEQFRVFSKQGAPYMEMGSVAGLLETVTQLAEAGSKAKYALHIAPDLWSVELDAEQMKLAVTNLLSNANEASTGGTITVRAENMELGNSNGEGVLPLPPGKYVRIAIRDQGQGIPPEVLSRIFDPYFSTKERGVQRGMGLGLPTAYSIIEKHGGFLQIHSEKCVGTTARVFLPAVPDPAEGADEPVLPRVLLMDDEEMVREVTGQILKRLGYNVDFAAEGEEAVRLYQEAAKNGDPFDAVILDLTIRGGMGGRETMAKLREIDPKIKGILLSGDTDDPVMTHFEEHGFREALTKPYRTDDLRRVLERISITA